MPNSPRCRFRVRRHGEATGEQARDSRSISFTFQLTSRNLFLTRPGHMHESKTVEEELWLTRVVHARPSHIKDASGWHNMAGTFLSQHSDRTRKY
eukprot:2516548-Pyramimonas_sp.AAC.1